MISLSEKQILYTSLSNIIEDFVDTPLNAMNEVLTLFYASYVEQDVAIKQGNLAVISLPGVKKVEAPTIFEAFLSNTEAFLNSTVGTITNLAGELLTTAGRAVGDTLSSVTRGLFGNGLSSILLGGLAIAGMVIVAPRMMSKKEKKTEINEKKENKKENLE